MSETRTLLLDLGEKAIRTRGFAGFSYADLARDAGIRKASIHHHFPAKADLGHALIERYAQNLSAELAEITSRSANAGQALNAAIELYRASCEDGAAACLCASLATDTALLSEGSQASLEAANDATRTWFEELYTRGVDDGSLTTGGDPAARAASTLALLQGAQLLAKAAGTTKAFDAAAATLKSTISG